MNSTEHNSPTIDATSTTFHHTYGLATSSSTHSVVAHSVTTTAVRSVSSGMAEPPSTSR